MMGGYVLGFGKEIEPGACEVHFMGGYSYDWQISRSSVDNEAVGSRWVQGAKGSAPECNFAKQKVIYVKLSRHQV